MEGWKEFACIGKFYTDLWFYILYLYKLIIAAVVFWTEKLSLEALL